MRQSLGSLARAHQIIREGVSPALNKHRTLNYVAFALLCYAWIAIPRSWPMQSFAVLLAAIINFMHYCGYPDRTNNR